MMGERRSGQDALFYEFSLERHVPAEHLLRSIDRFVSIITVTSWKASRPPRHSNLMQQRPQLATAPLPRFEKSAGWIGK
jgi:hypothetical protein